MRTGKLSAHKRPCDCDLMQSGNTLIQIGHTMEREHMRGPHRRTHPNVIYSPGWLKPRASSTPLRVFEPSSAQNSAKISHLIYSLVRTSDGLQMSYCFAGIHFSRLLSIFLFFPHSYSFKNTAYECRYCSAQNLVLFLKTLIWDPLRNVNGSPSAFWNNAPLCYFVLK